MSKDRYEGISEDELEAYFDEQYALQEAAQAEENNKPKRKNLDDPYESARWKALKSQENFLKVDFRKQLLRYLQEPHAMKRDDSQRQILKGYYSSLLELTYVIGDYFWAIKTKRNIDNKVEDVLKMLKEEELEEVNFNVVVHKAEMKLSEAYSEVNEWLDLCYFKPLNTGDMRSITTSLGKKTRMSWFRRHLKKYLSKLDVSTPPPTIARLFQQRYFVEQAQLERKLAKEKE